MFRIRAFVLFSFAFLCFSCKKQDTTPPVITITGGNSMTVSLPLIAGSNAWSPPSISANDDRDGDLSTAITATAAPDVNTKGVYVVTYSVNDNSGNQSQATLTVSVVNDVENFAGDYLVHDSIPTFPAIDYSMNISTDNFTNGRIHFNHGLFNSGTVGFAGYTNNYSIHADVSGPAVSLPLQTAGPIGTDNSNHTFSGNGSITLTNPLTFNITYADTDNTHSTSVSGCVQTYIHQ